MLFEGQTSTRPVRSVREDAVRSVVEKTSWIGHVEGSRKKVMVEKRVFKGFSLFGGLIHDTLGGPEIMLFEGKLRPRGPYEV